ncbi:MAG: TolC family protein [Bacteroidales bacterium]|jgi:outer membrane protein TolC|nr:TolC family protein [Bacteroidales bacterium]
MKKKINLLIFGILLSTPYNGGAQDAVPRLTALNELINMVLEQNYGIRIARNEARQAANDNTLGNAGFLPSVDLQGTASKATNNTRQQMFSGDVREGDNAGSQTLSAYVEATWTVFDGLRMFVMRDKLGLLEQTGAVNARYYMEQTVADVATAYYQLCTELSLLNNMHKMLQVSRFRFKLEERKRNIDASSTLAYNLATIDYHSDSLSVIQQQQVIRGIRIELCRLARCEPETEFLPSDSLQISNISSKEELIDATVRASSTLQLAQLQELVAEKDIRLLKAARYPAIDLTGRYSFSKQNNDIGVTQENRTYGRTFGVTVRMNLYDGGNLNRNIKNQKITIENMQLDRKDATELLAATVTDRWYEYQSLLQQQALAEENIRLAERSQEIASAQLQIGAINGYDFRQTQLSVISAQNRLTSIIFNLKALEIELARHTGELFNRFM